MTIVIPLCREDADSALRLLQWIAELGKQPNHCLLVFSQNLGMPSGNTSAALIIDAANKAFGSCHAINQSISLPNESHPIGPNLMFETALKHMARIKATEPWLWLEPDAIPMRKTWLQEIEKEYAQALASNKTILAHVTKLNDPRFPKSIPSGVAVYPAQAWQLYRRLQTNRTVAWDVQFADHIMPMVWASGRIYSILTRDNPPTFVKSRTANMARNQMDPKDIRPNVSLFHPSKDGTLIELLRQPMEPVTPAIKTPAFVEHDPLMLPALEEKWNPGTPWNIENFMATVPIIRTPKTAMRESKRANRIIHCLQRWKPDNGGTLRRIHTAFLSWLKVYSNGDVIPCHVWAPFDRDATSIGDARNLPFLKDILAAGMSRASSADDIIMLTNDDSVLHPDIANVIFERLSKSPCVCTGRLNYKPPAGPDFTNSDMPTRLNDIGRDAFAFRFDWLEKNMSRIPDMLLAEAQFDIVLGTLIRVANGVKPTLENRIDAIPRAELPYGYVQHEEHIRGWNQGPTPGQIYNLKLASKWYRDYGLPNMVDFDYTA